MHMLKFRSPYVLKGDLSYFENNFEPGDIDWLIHTGMWACNGEGTDEPEWIKNQKLHFVRILERDDLEDRDIVPIYAYLVSYNDTQFVIGSRENLEHPEFISLIPDELFEM